MKKLGKILKILRKIRKAIGDEVIHEAVGDFNYYTNGSYIVVRNIKKGEEISGHRIFDDDSSIRVKFDISKRFPTERMIVNWLKKAEKVATDELGNREIDNLKRQKKETLKAVRGLRKRIKEHE